MTNGNDPNDDAGNRAADYAADHVDSQLAEMDLEELCEEFDISLAEGLEIFDARHGYHGLRDFCLIVTEKARKRKCAAIEIGVIELAEEVVLQKLFDAMLCTAIRAHEPYRQQVMEKLQEQHRAGEVDDWMGQDTAEERAIEREGPQ